MVKREEEFEKTKKELNGLIDKIIDNNNYFFY